MTDGIGARLDFGFVWVACAIYLPGRSMSDSRRHRRPDFWRGGMGMRKKMDGIRSRSPRRGEER